MQLEAMDERVATPAGWTGRFAAYAAKDGGPDAPPPWVVAVASADELPAGDAWLAPAARRVLRRIATVDARDDFRASRLAARRAVRRLGSRPVALSLSHRLGRGAAVASAARGVRVGVDLEVAGSVPYARARYFLTPAERRAAVGRVELAALWALKEAAWKALAVRDTVCFSALELDLTESPNGVALRGVSLDGAYHAADGELRTPWPGFVLAAVRIHIVGTREGAR